MIFQIFRRLRDWKRNEEILRNETVEDRKGRRIKFNNEQIFGKKN